MHYDAWGLVNASDGTRLFYGSRGRGPAIVLVDGIGCDGWAWVYLQPHLADRYRVIHWHYRGHGRSGPPLDAGDATVEAHANDLLRVMDANQVEQAILIGHSMGTQVALEAYRLAPKRVTALVLICGTYGRVTSTFHDSDVLERLLPHLSKLAVDHGPLVRALWGRVPGKLAYFIGSWIGEIDGASLHRDDFVAYVEHLSTMDPDAYFTMLRLAGEHSAEDVLPRVDVPTLVVSGELDTFTPKRLAQHMAGQIPGAAYFEVAGGTHSTPAERPDVVNARIDSFLATHLL